MSKIFLQLMFELGLKTDRFSSENLTKFRLNVRTFTPYRVFKSRIQQLCSVFLFRFPKNDRKLSVNKRVFGIYKANIEQSC